MITKHRPLQVSVRILQIFIFVGIFFLQEGVTERRTEGLVPCWRCGAACLPVAETRSNVGHAFDSLDTCIFSYVHQWDLGDKT